MSAVRREASPATEGDLRAGGSSPPGPVVRPFVGRASSLTDLLRLAHAAFEERSSSAVLVTAPAGLGKSRLAAELVTALRAERPVTVWTGRGNAAFAGAPFLALAGLLRTAAGISLDDDPVTHAGALTALAESCLSPAVARSVGERLRGVLLPAWARTAGDEDSALPGALASGDRIRDAWITLLGAACDARPVVLILDDLHLVDRTTIAYAGSALHALRRAPLFLLALARPELEQTHPALWPHLPVTRLTLPALSRPEAEELCRALLPELSFSETAGEIVAAALGNPGRIERLARRARRGKPSTAPPPDASALVSGVRVIDPVALRALGAERMIAEHFEQAGDPEEATTWLLRAAESALEGNDFEAVLALAERALAQSPTGEPLGRVRLLQAEAHRWRAENASLQTRALEAMEAFPAGSPRWCAAAILTSIAHGRLGHRKDAVALGRAILDAADEAAPSRAWQRTAARIAADLCIAGAFDVAEALLARVESTADLSSEPLLSATVNEARGERALKEGRPGAAVRFFEASAKQYLSGGDARLAHRAAISAGAGYRAVGAYEQAERWLRDGQHICERLGLTSAAAAVDHALVAVLTCLGERAEARLAADRAIATYAASGNRRMEQATRIYLALLHAAQGDWDASAMEARAASAPLPGMPGLRAHALAALSRAELVLGRLPDAFAAAEEAFAILTSAGTIEEGAALVHLARVECLSAAGAIDAARDALFEAEAQIVERSRGVEDPTLREHFLWRIPDHAAILQLAEACRAV